MKISSVNKKIHDFFYISFLLVIFVYSGHGDINTWFFPYTTPAFLTIGAISFIIHIFLVKHTLKYFYSISLISSIVWLHFLLVASNSGDSADMNSFVRMYLITALYIYIGSLDKNYNFLGDRFIKFTFLYVLLFLIIHFLAPSFASLKDYGVWRFSALLSEPSALAPFLSALLIYPFKNDSVRYGSFFVAIIGIAVSASIIVVVVALLSVSIVKLRTKLLRTIGVFAIIYYVTTNLYPDIMPRFEKELSYMNNGLVSYLESGNIRIRTFYLTLSSMLHTDSLLFGYGLNQKGPFDSDDYAVFSLGHLYLLSYGIVGLVLYYLVSLYLIYRLSMTDSSTWLVPFVLNAMVNSAQGFYIQGFWWIAFSVVFFKYYPQILDSSDEIK